MCRIVNMSWRMCVFVTKIQSNPSVTKSAFLGNAIIISVYDNKSMCSIGFHHIQFHNFQICSTYMHVVLYVHKHLSIFAWGSLQWLHNAPKLRIIGKCGHKYCSEQHMREGTQLTWSLMISSLLAWVLRNLTTPSIVFNSQQCAAACCHYFQQSTWWWPFVFRLCQW